VSIKSLHFIGSITFAAAILYGQSEPPTTGAVYWAASPPDCSSLNESAVTITSSTGATLGYSCYVTGTFVWLAAGGPWSSQIRVGAPASNPIGVDYTFFEPTVGNSLSLDTNFGGTSATTTGNDVNFVLNANEPSVVNLLGQGGGGPSYTNIETGSVYGIFYCPDATTCSNVQPQLLYSAIPTNPWSLSVPIVWDDQTSTQWSAVGIDDGTYNRVSLVIYNESTAAATYNIDVYDVNGNLAGSVPTPSIAGFQAQSSGSPGEAGTYGVVLRTLFPSIPAGYYKILVDGGTVDSAVSMLQFTGPGASSLQVAYDTAPGASAMQANSRKASVRRGARPALTKALVITKRPK
jgi:hypothetical protein